MTKSFKNVPKVGHNKSLYGLVDKTPLLFDDRRDTYDATTNA